MFSDGGRYLDQHAAISQADDLLEAGADVIDLGAVASNPDFIRIPVRVEIERLAPVIAHLQARDALGFRGYVPTRSADLRSATRGGVPE